MVPSAFPSSSSIPSLVALEDPAAKTTKEVEAAAAAAPAAAPAKTTATATTKAAAANGGLRVPRGLQEALRGLAREALRHQPTDVVDFARW